MNKNETIAFMNLNAYRSLWIQIQVSIQNYQPVIWKFKRSKFHTGYLIFSKGYFLSFCSENVLSINVSPLYTSLKIEVEKRILYKNLYSLELKHVIYCKLRNPKKHSLSLSQPSTNKW